MKNILFLQFANSFYLRHDSCDRYWDAFYDRNRDFGYYRTKHVFEVPKWIAEISYFTKGYEKKVLYIEHSINEALNEIEKGVYDYVLFSLMNANQSFIEDIVIRCPQQKFIIGGYNEEYLQNIKTRYNNVIVTETTKEVADILNVPYSFGTDYTLFKGDTVLPRLTMSYGCLNRCKFCIVPHGKITDVERNYIEQQVDSFKDLEYKLIYVDDKTFGQSSNWKITSELSQRIGKTDFNGFVVQTTSGMVVRNAPDFVKHNVSVVEIGLETYNDDILKAYTKPSSNRLVDEAVKRANDNGLKLIANIIVGLPEENNETYKRTFDYVMPLLEEQKIIGINPAIYTDYNDNENLGEIDFKQTDKIDIHREWWKKFNETASNILNKLK